MSLLWRDRIHIFLAPGRVNMVGISRGIKPIQQFRRSVICKQADDAGQWQEPLQLLEQMLKQEAEKIRKGAELHVTLSNHFVRYGVVAPQSSLANPDELMAYANFRMRETYGDRVECWVLSLSTWGPCSGALCAAIPLDLQSELEALAQQHKVRLARIEPYLAAVLDYWSKDLDSRRLWFALIETERFCLVSMLDGVWHCVRNQRVVENPGEELLSALEQEVIVSGQKQLVERVHVFAPESGGQLPVDDRGWRFLKLSSGKRPVPPYFPCSQKAVDQSGHA